MNENLKRFERQVLPNRVCGTVLPLRGRVSNPVRLDLQFSKRTEKKRGYSLVGATFWLKSVSFGRIKKKKKKKKIECRTVCLSPSHSLITPFARCTQGSLAPKHGGSILARGRRCRKRRFPLRSEASTGFERRSTKN